MYNPAMDLDAAPLDPDPFVQFRRWFADAVAAGLHEPSAMTLATATPEGRPSSRIVLLKGVDDRGLVFFTNYESRKGRELAENPRAALAFWWPPLGRQVRVEGSVERVTREESEAYFRTRPRASQISAWASRQSAELPGRAPLDARVAELEREYAGGRPIPCPPFWGGLRVVPETFEFWIGRPSRLHDRFRYVRSGPAWRIARLAP
jgi:pyridoxamine 5'-phosphate oxidase